MPPEFQRERKNRLCHQHIDCMENCVTWLHHQEILCSGRKGGVPPLNLVGHQRVRLHWVFLSTSLVISNWWWWIETVAMLISIFSSTDRKIWFFSKAAVKSVSTWKLTENGPAVVGEWSTSVTGCFCECAVLNHDWFGPLSLCLDFQASSLKCVHTYTWRTRQSMGFVM